MEDVTPPYLVHTTPTVTVRARLPFPNVAPRQIRNLLDRVVMDADAEAQLRHRRGDGSARDNVVFLDPPVMSELIARELCRIYLRVVFNPHTNGMEAARELHPEVGEVFEE